MGQKRREWLPGSPPAADLYRWKTATGRLSLELSFVIESETGMIEGKIIFFQFAVHEIMGEPKESRAAFLR